MTAELRDLLQSNGRGKAGGGGAPVGPQRHAGPEIQRSLSMCLCDVNGSVRGSHCSPDCPPPAGVRPAYIAGRGSAPEAQMSCVGEGALCGKAGDTYGRPPHRRLRAGHRPVRVAGLRPINRRQPTANCRRLGAYDMTQRKALPLLGSPPFPRIFHHFTPFSLPRRPVSDSPPPIYWPIVAFTLSLPHFSTKTKRRISDPRPFSPIFLPLLSSTRPRSRNRPLPSAPLPPTPTQFPRQTLFRPPTSSSGGKACCSAAGLLSAFIQHLSRIELDTHSPFDSA